MARWVTVAATQMRCSNDRQATLNKAEALVREAARQGANVILLQELFETPYFCQDMRYADFALATPIAENPAIRRLAAVAAELGVVLPVSFFERAGQTFFNTVAMIDANGAFLGRYRKSHIPDSPGYTEKFFFAPGDTGFQVWNTRFGCIGVGICWDQWFPECARAMALLGADMLLYPTAIGSEPQDQSLDSRDQWQLAMQGHAACNLIPVIAANRIGTESGANGTSMTFHGSSFITDHRGAKLAEADRTSEAVITARFDLDKNTVDRAAWGVFRDRRPDLYGGLLTLDGGR